MTYDPSAYNLFPVGYLEYDNGYDKGSVYYPAVTDGENQLFNGLLAKQGRVSIVFMAHGNHGTHYNPRDRSEEWARRWTNETPPAGWPPIPNYQGYDYFQQQLARMGIIAVSVDCNATNRRGGGPGNIEDRADVIIGSIVEFQRLDSDPTSIFYEHIDFQSVALMGHSRGGEAVVLVTEVIKLPSVNIKAVLALAPTDFGSSRGQPNGSAFMTILPAGDGDVWFNDGAKFYDQAQPSPFKSQLYVHDANHNFFNRQWLLNDGDGPQTMSRSGHEQILSVYGCALFRTILLHDVDTVQCLSGHMIPMGAPTDNVHLSFQQKDALTVDDHEDGNGISLNSLGLATTQIDLYANEYPFKHVRGAFNDSFFGNSIGMVALPRWQRRPTGRFHSPVDGPIDMTHREVWVRVAEVFDGLSIPAGTTGFELGLEDDQKTVVWVDSNEVGGLPRPYNRTRYIKTMLKTLRFPGSYFVAANPKFNIGAVRAILIHLNRGDRRALAFDDLQIVLD